MPSVAASGILAAHTFVPLDQHRAAIEKMKSEGTFLVGNEWWKGEKTPPMAPGGRISVLAAEDEPTYVDLTKYPEMGFAPRKEGAF